MIVHVFTGNRYHLVPSISKGIALTYKNQEHFFVLAGDSSIDKDKYIELYKGIGFSNYCLCTNNKELFDILVKNRNHPIVFHAGEYGDFVSAYLAGCKNVNWVCWGAGASIGKSIKSKLITPMKRILYQHFGHIVVLMTPDKNTIIRDFGVKEKNISVIPYSSSLSFDAFELSESIRVKNIGLKNEKPRILLGNNPGNIPHYITMLHQLSRFAGKVEIHCMCQYSLVKDEKYNELAITGESIYGNDFYIDEDFMDKEQYNKYISSFDIYMCGSKSQTGLGAIGFCIRLGKKVYIAGKNLEWIKDYYNALVYNICSIDNMSFDEFVKPLSEKEILNNINSLKSKINENISQWETWYHTIESK